MYDYAFDNSEFPCYLVWPVRDWNYGYHGLDTSTEDFLTLEEDSFFRLLGIQHFYDVFAFETHLSIRKDLSGTFWRSRKRVAGLSHYHVGFGSPQTMG